MRYKRIEKTSRIGQESVFAQLYYTTKRRAWNCLFGICQALFLVGGCNRPVFAWTNHTQRRGKVSSCTRRKQRPAGASFRPPTSQSEGLSATPKTWEQNHNIGSRPNSGAFRSPPNPFGCTLLFMGCEAMPILFFIQYSPFIILSLLYWDMLKQ